MEVPRGFTRCKTCLGKGRHLIQSSRGPIEYDDRPCRSCSGSGLVPTEKLREEAERAIDKVEGGGFAVGSFTDQADAVLRRVAEHVREGR